MPQHKTKIRLIALLILCLATFGCESRTTIQTSSCLSDSKFNETQIISAVEKELDALPRGIVELDAALIFSIFSKVNPTTYVREGMIYEKVSDAEEHYANGFKHVKTKREFKFLQKQFDVLSASTVLFTGVGVITSPEEKSEPWQIAYSILWVLEPTGWKAINMHISWKDKK